MRKTVWMLSLAATLALAGCDQARELVGGGKPATVAETNLRVLELAQQGKSIDALKLGEEFLKGHDDPDGTLHGTLAKLYTEIGDTDSAVRHLQQSHGSRSAVTVTTTTERASTERTPTETAQPAARAAAGTVSATVDGVTATAGPGGVSARAGGVSASVRP